jgi:hypothetical protein
MNEPLQRNARITMFLKLIRYAREEWEHLQESDDNPIFKGDYIWGGTTGITHAECVEELLDFFREGGRCDFCLQCISDLGGPSLRSRLIRQELGIEDRYE